MPNSLENAAPLYRKIKDHILDHIATGEWQPSARVPSENQPTGFDCGVIEVGRRADMIMLDPASPLLIGTPDKYLLDRLIFSGNQSPVKHVMIGGKWVVRDRTHPGAEEITNVFRNTMERLAKILD